MSERGELAIVFSGGGASAAYQVGFLCHIAERHPNLKARILTGVSAGAVNAAVLAGLPGTFAERVSGLQKAWSTLQPESVYRSSGLQLMSRAMRYGLRLVSGRQKPVKRPQSLLDTAPLRAFLQGIVGLPDGRIAGIREKIQSGELLGVAMSASSYYSGRSVTWLSEQSANAWTGPHRETRPVPLCIEHVMASTALPLLFPAIPIDGEWFGDGSIGFTSPFSPAIHLGASRILAISTRRASPSSAPKHLGPYPPPAQIAGAMLNALFFEHSHSDALRLHRINELLSALPPGKEKGLRQVQLLVLDPVSDLGALANKFEPRLPRTLRFLTRGLGTGEDRGGELLSLLMFQGEFLSAL
ncbi:MAG: patatin-like phospholipase family protein, partial [Planctomycetota bacterium]